MSFFKTILATIIGFFLAFFIFFVFLILVSLGSTSSPEPFVAKSSVLVINLSGPVFDRIPNDPFAEFTGQSSFSGVSLEAMTKSLKKASNDSRIEAVWLKTGFVEGSWALLSEIRAEIERFASEQDKPVYASAADIGFNEASWFLASAADSIFAPPESLFEMDGFYVESFFLKGLFDKVGIEPEILRFGRYKSAIEPYIAKEYSKENEEQLLPLINIAANDFVRRAAEVSGLSETRIHELINERPRISMQFAIDQGLVQATAYPEDVEARLKRELAVSGKLKTVSLDDYLLTGTEVSVGDSDGNVAILYLNGMILPEISEDFGEATGISYTWFDRQADAIEKDKRVKAVVLRIDSPGGSGATSDLIWNRVNLLKQKKPVVASISDVAASGGYYIAMAADTIVANPASITGSIGVFSTKFNAQKLFNDQLGITFDAVKSHEHADWFSPVKGLSPVQRETFQKLQDDFYNTFIQRVAASRGMEPASVHAVAQGRVWTGADAQKAGLIDVIGSFDDAIDLAAALAGLESFGTEVYPKRKTLTEILLSGDLNQLESGIVSRMKTTQFKELEMLRFIAENQLRLTALLPVTPVLR